MSNLSKRKPSDDMSEDEPEEAQELVCSAVFHIRSQLRLATFRSM